VPANFSLSTGSGAKESFFFLPALDLAPQLAQFTAKPETSGPIPAFASACGTLESKCRNHKDR
jgi:hypothetical protein